MNPVISPVVDWTLRNWSNLLLVSLLLETVIRWEWLAYHLGGWLNARAMERRLESAP